MNETEELSAQKETVLDKIEYKYLCFKGNVKQKIIKQSLNLIKKMGGGGGLVNHAKNEFNFANKQEYKDKYIKDNFDSFQQDIINMISVFGTMGCSGGSAPFYSGTFTTLSRYNPLGPIFGTDEEWSDCIDMGDPGTYQNKRLSSVFKRGKDSVPYYLDAIIWQDQSGCTFTGKVEEFSSRQSIRLPFTPKSFYIDVISTEWADEEESKEQEGGGWWTHVIKDRKQLDEVFEYYDFYETT